VLALRIDIEDMDKTGDCSTVRATLVALGCAITNTVTISELVGIGALLPRQG